MLSLEQAHHAPSHVYFVYSNRRVKIGVSKRWFQRVETVIRGCPGVAELVLLLPGDRDLERRLHDAFAEHRVNGEWFEIDGVRDFILKVGGQRNAEVLAAAEAGYASMAW